MDSDETAAEILRLRDRLHDVESELVGIRFMLNDIREWRAEARTLLDRFGRELEHLSDTMAADREQASKLRSETASRWTRREKLAALAIGLLAAVSPHLGGWSL